MTSTIKTDKWRHSIHWLCPLLWNLKSPTFISSFPDEPEHGAESQSPLDHLHDFHSLTERFQQPGAFFPFRSVSNSQILLLEDAPHLEDIRPQQGWVLSQGSLCCFWCWIPELSKVGGEPWKGEKKWVISSILSLALKGKRWNKRFGAEELLTKTSLATKKFGFNWCDPLPRFVHANSSGSPWDKSKTTKNTSACSVSRLSPN